MCQINMFPKKFRYQFEIVTKDCGHWTAEIPPYTNIHVGNTENQAIAMALSHLQVGIGMGTTPDNVKAKFLVDDDFDDRCAKADREAVNAGMMSESEANDRRLIRFYTERCRARCARSKVLMK